MPDDLKYKDHIEHYRVDAERFDYFSCDYPSRSALERYRAKLAVGTLDLSSDVLALDVGCGGGMLSAEILRTGARVVGVDLSSKNLRRVRQELDNERFHPVVADIYHPPFRDRSFGAIFLSSLLEHLERPEEAVQQSASLLKEGSYLVVVVPYREKIRYHLCIHCNRPTPGFAHLHSFDESKLSELLRGADFKVAHLERFANKLIGFLGGSRLLSSLPFQIVHSLDRLLCLLFPRMEFLLVVAKAGAKSNSD
jgi:SAM-dependent methyltransferase